VSDAPLADAVRRLAAAGIDNPRLDARLLWEHAHKASLSPTGGEGRGEGASVLFESFLSRRIAHEPLASITGRKEFWSLEFEVGPGVLVPRPETETIVEEAIALLPDRSAPLRLLDFGTGSGCLLAALLKEFPNSRGLGIDCSEEARGYAQRNLTRLGLAGRGEIKPGDWGEGIKGPFDLIVSNPPYIRSADIEGLAPEVARYEPRLALDGGPDGLGALRKMAPQLARLIAPGGIALVEIGAGQGAEAASVMTQAGLAVVRTAPDLAGIPRVLVIKPGG
jgi:release factor glutamine methyltransferase